MSQSETIRLLIINDDASEVERLLSMLRNSGRNTRAQHVPSIEGLEKLLSDQAWDLLLAVDSAKSCDPKAALRSIKKLDKDIPVVFLTEVDPDEFNIALIDGMKAGARDVVILDDDQHLLMVMSRELGNLQERRERRSADRKLKESEGAASNFARQLPRCHCLCRRWHVPLCQPEFCGKVRLCRYR